MHTTPDAHVQAIVFIALLSLLVQSAKADDKHPLSVKQNCPLLHESVPHLHTELPVAAVFPSTVEQFVILDIAVHVLVKLVHDSPFTHVAVPQVQKPRSTFKVESTLGQVEMADILHAFLELRHYSDDAQVVVPQVHEFPLVSAALPSVVVHAALKL